MSVVAAQLEEVASSPFSQVQKMVEKFPADFRSLIVEIFQFAGVMRPHPLAPPMSRPQLPKVYDVRPKVLMNHEYS